MTVFTKIEKYKDGELQILKQSKSSFQGKIYLGKHNNLPRYKYKSVKTNDINDALNQLNSWFFEVKYLSNSNQLEKLSPIKNKAKNLIKKYLEKHIFLNKKSKSNDQSLSKNIIEFLDKYKIDEFNKKNLLNLKNFLSDKSFTKNTIRHHFNVLRKMYRDLLNDDVIQKDEVPEFPILPKNASKITYLDFDEYKHLKEISKKRMEQIGLSRSVALARKSLHCYIQFMCGSGLRRSEASRLKFEDIKVDFDKIDKTYSLEISIKNGKTGSRTVITKSSSYHAFENLKKIYNEYSDLIKQELNSKVFPKDFKKSANELFKAAGLYKDKNGYERNLTSLRKTYICWGLINDEKIFDIAINCGNSPEIIKSNYADKLTSVKLKNRLRKFKIYTTSHTTNLDKKNI